MKDISKLIAKVVESVEGAGSGFEAAPKNWISTGNYALNKIISGDFHKGLPFGKVVEVFGEPSTGKSLMLSHLMATIQKMGGIAILDDTENAYNPFFGQVVGVNNDDLIRISSKTVEEHIEKMFIGFTDKEGKARKSILQMLLKDDPELPIFVGLDSLANLSTRHERDTAFETNDMSKAKLIKKGYRLSAEFLERHNVLYVVANHVYTKIGVLYGNPKATPGGSGTPFQSSVRLDLNYGSKIKDDVEEGEDAKKGRLIGTQVHVTVAKNRLFPPFGKATLEIMFDRGIDPDSGLLDVLVEYNIVQKTGKGIYGFNGKTFRTNEFESFLDQNREDLLKSSEEVQKIV